MPCLYLRVNTTNCQSKDRLLEAVCWIYPDLLWELYDTDTYFVGTTQNFLMLKQVAHVLTTRLQRVNSKTSQYYIGLIHLSRFHEYFGSSRAIVVMVHVVLLIHLAARQRADRPTTKSNVSPTLSSGVRVCVWAGVWWLGGKSERCSVKWESWKCTFNVCDAGYFNNCNTTLKKRTLIMYYSILNRI